MRASPNIMPVLCLLFLIALSVPLVGCRYAGCSFVSGNNQCPVDTRQALDRTEQGKSVPIKGLTDLALSAAQGGNPTSTQTDNSTTPADSIRQSQEAKDHIPDVTKMVAERSENPITDTPVPEESGDGSGQPRGSADQEEQPAAPSGGG